MTLQTTTSSSSKFPMPTRDQIASIGRGAGVAAGAAATVATVLGVMTPEQSAAFVADVHAVIDDLTNLFGDLSKLVLLVFPIASFWLAKIGYHAASPSSQVASVQALTPKALTTAVQAVAPRELVAATQALPAAQVTVTDPALASPGVKVASTT